MFYSTSTYIPIKKYYDKINIVYYSKYVAILVLEEPIVIAILGCTRILYIMYILILLGRNNSIHFFALHPARCARNLREPASVSRFKGVLL